MILTIYFNSSTSKQYTSITQYLDSIGVTFFCVESDVFRISLLNRDGVVVGSMNKFSNSDDVIALQKLLLVLNKY